MLSDTKMLELRMAEISENRAIESSRGPGSYLPGQVERENINIPRFSEPLSSSPFADEDGEKGA